MAKKAIFLISCIGVGLIAFSLNMWESENDIRNMFNLERYGFHRNKLSYSSSSSLRGNENVSTNTAIKWNEDTNDENVAFSSIATQHLQEEEEEEEEKEEDDDDGDRTVTAAITSLEPKQKQQGKKKPSNKNKNYENNKPILVVGMPKAGTTTIYEYFRCGKYKTSHWRCHTHEELCGALIRKNIQENKPPLQNTGNYDVYAQMDGDCYFPQIHALEEIHQYYPNATLILNQRNISSWIHSMRTFQAGYYEIKPEYKHETLCEISEKNSTTEEYISYYNKQVDRIYKFVEKYPSHTLVDVSIDDDAAGGILEDAFGISSEKCWGQANKDQKEGSGKNQLPTNKNNKKKESSKLLTSNNNQQQQKGTVHKPILVVGLPKGGTTTIYNYFKCGGYKTSHWKCKTDSDELLCGALIRENIKASKPPLQNTGNYDVYAQLDGDCYFPQNDALEEIHQHYPDSTFILNMRDAKSWVHSVRNFVPGPGAYIQKYGGYPHVCSNRTDEDMIVHYNNHISDIRDFVKKYPTHKLVEFYLEEEENAGRIMEDSFGIPSNDCWGHANVNVEQVEKKNLGGHVIASQTTAIATYKATAIKDTSTTAKKVNKPILVVGMPKGGTTTLEEYFKCGGYRVSHWRCGGKNELCGALIRENVKLNKPPLQNTGDYDVYAQLDGDCYFPQIVALDEIHESYPDATFILNLRNAESWVKSVNNFEPDSGAYIPKYGMPHPCTNQTNVDKVGNYNKHTDRIHNFVADHPSHLLVEFYLEDENAGTIMENAFGISAKDCWGKANVNENNH